MSFFNFLILNLIYFCVIKLSSVYCSINITILHNNDFHTHFESINKWNSKCKTNETCFGGIARTVTKVNEILNDVNENKNVLFLNGGDHFQGTIWYTFGKWKVVAEFVKLMRHDVMALGNHEFDDGVKDLILFIKNMTQNKDNTTNTTNITDVHIVCSNIETSGPLKQLIQPSVVLKRGDVNIAIIGYITPDTKFLARPGNTVKFNDEIESIKKEIKSLKSRYGQSLNIFIALGHSGFEKDKEIAAKIPELDIVVGGHTNTFLYNGEPPSNEVPEGPYPVTFNDNKTLVVQAFAYGKYLGKLDVSFDDNGVITSFRGNPILLDSSVEENSDVLSKVKEKAAEIEVQYNETIGYTFVNLNDSLCRQRECNTGNMFADAFVSYFIDQTISRDQSWTTVSAAVVNGGAVRSGFGVGNITSEDIISSSPFGNLVGVLKVNGSILWQMFEHSASQFQRGGFLQVSGIRYKFDSTQIIGKRLQSVRIKCADCLTPIYEDLDFNKSYALAITEYIVNGGDNYTMIDSSDFTPYEMIDFDIISIYVKTYSPVLTPIEDRIINIKEIQQDNCEQNNNQSNGQNNYKISDNSLMIVVMVCLMQLFNNY